jgi:hypothetical protein
MSTYGVCIYSPRIGTSGNSLWVFDPQGGQENGKAALIKFQNESDFSVYMKGKASKLTDSNKTFEMFIFKKQ